MGTSLIRTGSDKNEDIGGIFVLKFKNVQPTVFLRTFLILRRCHRPFSLRLLNNNKKTAPDRLPPRRMELAHFGAENSGNIPLENGFPE